MQKSLMVIVLHSREDGAITKLSIIVRPGQLAHINTVEQITYFGLARPIVR
jgi:hypothetical protein